jgi:alkylation response protein AidB-like acyl-CoA dehydrogenase
MDMDFSAADETFRAEVRQFLERELTPELRRGGRLTSGVFAEQDIALPWQRKLHAQGWAAPHWPVSAGGPGWSPVQRYIFETECARAGAPVLPFMALKLVGPVIYTFGTDAQKATYLPAILDGSDFWAQGFSEPGSGSDLASLRTKAVREGNVYRVNGSKIWTTQAQYANRIFCLVRTNMQAKAQRGISFLLMDMDLPGITVRPIKSVSGDHEVNEVFFDDVLVPAENLVGAEGEGWSIAKFLLDNERGGSCFAPAFLVQIDRLRRCARAQSDGNGRSMAESPLFRDRLARTAIAAEALEITELRVLADMTAGREAGPISRTTKLIASEIRQEIDALAVDLYGYSGLQLPEERPFYGAEMPLAVGTAEAQIASAQYLNSRAWSIFGGTSEIQLNIIAKAALGL